MNNNFLSRNTNSSSKQIGNSSSLGLVVLSLHIMHMRAMGSLDESSEFIRTGRSPNNPYYRQFEKRSRN